MSLDVRWSFENFKIVLDIMKKLIYVFVSERDLTREGIICDFFVVPVANFCHRYLILQNEVIRLIQQNGKISAKGLRGMHQRHKVPVV